MSVNNLIIDTAIVLGVADGFASPKPHGPPRFSSPFDGDNANYILEEDYVVSLASFTNIALNTVHPVYAGYYLVKESELSPVMVSDVVKWTRTYVSIPATRNDYSTIAYKFPGFAGNMGVMNLSQQFAALGFVKYVPGRLPFTQTVSCIIVNEYFMVGTGGAYPNAESIPVNIAQRYYISPGTVTVSGSTFTFVPLFPPVGGITDSNNGVLTDYLANAASGNPYFITPIPSTPSRDAYQAFINAGTLLVAEDSSVSRFMGNIFCRVTKKVVAR